ncbi:MAG: sulfatase-like hydrolase/transferase, partial [Desulfobacterales bacterium]|nr:sulfatase-like hydrolase/transferase [Desulfobacterales bacterium]
DNGFDTCFSTEAKVPTWDPMINPNNGKPYGTHYWSGPKEMVTENLEGDDSRVIMDRALPFITQAADSNTPFLAVIWFHTPHKPVVAGKDYTALYGDHPGAKYLGTLSAMDDQIGRLRQHLAHHKLTDQTMLWFCSDNGPEENKDTLSNGTAAHLRGRKRDLYEGGIRVPGLLIWPNKIKNSRTVDIPCCTSDYLPTVADILNLTLPDKPYDGISLYPLIQGTMTERPAPIGFESKNQLALIDNRYKLYSKDNGKTFALYDLINDPSETTDLAKVAPVLLKTMTETFFSWQTSCTDSRKRLLAP